MESPDLATTHIGRTLMKSSKKNHEYGWLEAKQSGGAVYGLGVKESKRNKAIRRIAQPLTDRHWLNKGQSVTMLHRIYRIAEYLLERQKRHK